MEEKERYGCRYIRGEFDVFIDNETDKYLTIQEVKHLLNQQDKRIKELEQENLSLQEQSIRDNQNWIEETTQLKQQLHDLPNKIVREIEEEIIKYDLLKNFPNEAGYCMLDSILDTILKKYGVENE